MLSLLFDRVHKISVGKTYYKKNSSYLSFSQTSIVSGKGLGIQILLRYEWVVKEAL